MQGIEHVMRDLGPQDADKLLNLSQSMAWDYTRQYWQILLATSVVIGAFDDSDNLVATGSKIYFPMSHCFVGAVIVTSALQGRGICKKIMQILHEKIDQRNVPAQLIATPEGAPLYQKLGYEQVDTCFKMVRENMECADQLSKISDVSCKPLNREVMSKIIDFDQEQFRADRSHLLNALLECGYSGIYLEDKANSEINGYAFRIDRADHLCIGPVVALSEAYAILLCQMLSYGQTRALRVDSFSGKEGFRQGLEKIGFKLVDKAPLMVRGNPKDFTVNENAFALTSQAFG